MKVELHDFDSYAEQIKCRDACPIHTNAGEYCCAVGKKEYEDAYGFARAPNPFVYTLGRVCANPCETACRRGLFDAPVSIRRLKRVATESHDPELGHFPGKTKLPPNRRKVAVIGAGPAGLSCAHDLSLIGYEVTVFEKSPVAGGMLYLGIPAWRLPRDILRMEIEAIKNLGVDIRLNTALGEGFDLDSLWREGYEAVFLAIGAHKSRDLPLDGLDLPGVYKSVEFLFDINMGRPIALGKRVVVIGGGNVAIDVARSVYRTSRDPRDLDKLTPEQMKKAILMAAEVISSMDAKQELDQEGLTHALDAARAAMRVSGVKEIHMVCLESREEMPAHPWEVTEAEEEGIKIHPSRGPRRIIDENGKIVGLETIGVKSVFDEHGRFNPTFFENSESILPVDSVILAIGHAADLGWIKPGDGIELTPRGAIKVEAATLKTTAERVWAGGDVAFGPRLIVEAIANGQTVACQIHEYLTETVKKGNPYRMVKMPNRFISPGCLQIPRHEPDYIPLDDRRGKNEVELTLSPTSASEEGERCLQCFVNTVFDSDKCILCGGCADVCPESCLELVDLASIAQTDQINQVLIERFGAGGAGLDIDAAAIVKDETFCIRCGLCADRCPAGAITMEKFEPMIEQKIPR